MFVTRKVGNKVPRIRLYTVLQSLNKVLLSLLVTHPRPLSFFFVLVLNEQDTPPYERSSSEMVGLKTNTSFKRYYFWALMVEDALTEMPVLEKIAHELQSGSMTPDGRHC